MEWTSPPKIIQNHRWVAQIQTKKQQRTACLCLFESWPSSGQILKYWGNLLYQAQLVPGHFDPHEKQPEQLWYF